MLRSVFSWSNSHTSWLLISEIILIASDMSFIIQVFDLLLEFLINRMGMLYKYRGIIYRLTVRVFK